MTQVFGLFLLETSTMSSGDQIWKIPQSTSELKMDHISNAKLLIDMQL